MRYFWGLAASRPRPKLLEIVRLGAIACARPFTVGPVGQ